jgi:hypothetical protein
MFPLQDTTVAALPDHSWVGSSGLFKVPEPWDSMAVSGCAFKILFMSYYSQVGHMGQNLGFSLPLPA